jgi:hypothetical protein
VVRYSPLTRNLQENTCNLRASIVLVQLFSPVPVLLLLFALQVLFDEIEPEHPEFERIRKPAEQWRFLLVFKLIKARDDAVGLLSPP